MAALRSHKRLALDTNVLLDRANEESFAIGFIEGCTRNGISLYITYTVAAELDFISKNGTADEQEAATKALDSLHLVWGIKALENTDVELDYRRNFVTIVGKRRVLPPEEVNDARILAEVGNEEIGWLVTSDRTLLAAASDPELKRAFADAGLSHVIPVSAREITKGFSKR